jgi:hypothetical protein
MRAASSGRQVGFIFRSALVPNDVIGAAARHVLLTALGEATPLACVREGGCLPLASRRPFVTPVNRLLTGRGPRRNIPCAARWHSREPY